MRIVSQNSDTDLARRHAGQNVELALQELTANLLRVIRGAGEPREIGLQALAFVEATETYQDVVRRPLFVSEVKRMLSIEQDEQAMRRKKSADRIEFHGMQAIICGALQIAASRILCQPRQEASGRREIEDGLRLLEDARAESRQETAAAGKAALPRRTASLSPPVGFLKPRRANKQE
ncbi:hypothetical protein [Inquilinus sp. CA228]|uniref:hypothetical protein n=1 Tax=Inquilinus sp. CA228 TaxID=3455609 RepID=UPI003F8D2667